MKNKITLIFMVIFTLLIISCENKQITFPKYLATNTWTASYANLAGIDGVESFAPSNMVHPPDYEFKPKDIERLMKAEVIFLCWI